MWFYPTIDKPTRVTSNSASFIDNIFTNLSNIDVCAKVDVAGIFITDFSDHFPVFIHSTLKSSSVSSNLPLYSRNYFKRKIQNFSSSLSSIDWNDVYQANDTNTAFNVFSSLFSQIYTDSFPLSIACHKQKRKQQWITSGMLVSIKRKNRLYKRYLKSPTQTTKETYTTYRNKLNHILRVAKRNYYAFSFNCTKHGSKKTWDNINTLLNRGKKVFNYPVNFTDNGVSISNPLDIANAFNTFFTNLGPDLAKNIPNRSPSNLTIGNYAQSIFISPVSCNDVVKVTTECLKLKTAAGFDEIRPAVVHQVIHLVQYQSH